MSAGDRSTNEAAEPSGPPARGSARARLLLYFSGQATNLIGDAIFLVALPFLYLGEHRLTDLSIVLTAYTLGRLVLVIIGGAVTDRWGPQRIMIVSDLARCLLLLVMLEFHEDITSNVGLGVVVFGALGALAGVFQPAFGSMLPTLVDKERFQSANSINSMLTSGATMVGPALGGFLVAYDVDLVFALNAASFLISSITVIALAWLIGTVDRAPGSPTFLESLGTSPRLWWQMVVASRTLRVTCVVIAIANLTWSGLINIGLPQAMIDLGGGSSSYGWTMTAAGCGTVLGGLLASRLDRFQDKGRVAMLLGLVQAVCVLLSALMGSVVGVAILFTILGIANPITGVTMISMVQAEADRREIGRTMALTQLCAFGPQTLSAGIGAGVVAAFGATGMFVVTGVTLALSFTYGLAYLPRPGRRPRTAEPGPADGVRSSRSIEEAN